MPKTPKTPKHADDRAIDTASLRDYFAATALRALVSDLSLNVEQTCAAAYDYADAMLLERTSRDDADDMA